MAFLRQAVEQQKEVLINTLINEGIVGSSANNLKEKTITELLNEYDQFQLTTKKSDKNALRFTRSIHIAQNKANPLQ